MKALNTYDCDDFPDSFFLDRRKRPFISVCFPALNEERTIGEIAAHAVALMSRRVIDEVVVAYDGTDRTGEIAAAAGARIIRQSDCYPGLGPLRGKGDALWRVLPELGTGNGRTPQPEDVVVFCDADSGYFGEHFIRGLAGPIVVGEADFVKGFFRRPFDDGSGNVKPTGGGRVTQLTALPALRLLYPELAGFHQPLAGEMAATRGVWEGLDFPVRYGVEISTLIQVYRKLGLERMAQTNLRVRQNAHQSLEDLSDMATQVLGAALELFLGPAAWAATHHTPIEVRPAHRSGSTS